MLVPYVLSAIVAHCAPSVGPVTMSAIVAYESGAHANAIGDNTSRKSYEPTNRGSAIALARQLIGMGHNIDVGYAQVNSENFRAYGLSVAAAFDPCANVATGAAILRGNYSSAARTYGPGQVALVHALSAYNTGGYWGGLEYARNVYATAARLRYQDPRPVQPSGATAFGQRRAVAFHAARHDSVATGGAR